MGETLEYLEMFARLPFAVRRFARHRLMLPQAEQIVCERMAQRQENFLAVVQRAIYNNPRSPYLKLLQLAGCKFEDIQALVKQNGVEGALCELRGAGVYVTYEEFKGRKAVERGGKTIPVTARDFDNPFARHDFTLQSSGSTGLATMVNQDLDNLAAISPELMVTYAAHNISDVPVMLWGQFLPGPGIRNIFQAAYMGQPIQKWFAPNGWRDSNYWYKYSIATLYILACARMFGLRAPLPQIVRYEHAEIVARYLATMLKQHGRVLVYGAIGRALRICLAAAEHGLDLSGAVLRSGGEPITPAKAAAFARVGARLLPGYTSTETGTIGLGCAHPNGVDDVHLFQDEFALITYPYSIPAFGTTVPAFNITCLLDTAPKILLNTQLDDYGIVEERNCGCGLEAYGYTTHLREIRSYSKLVGESVTLIGNELLNILEKVLPARFGGRSLDYQLVEQEDEKGLTRVQLVIDPRVQIADEQAVIQVVWNALRDSSAMADAARMVWQQTNTIQIKRAQPTLTASGKVLPLHIQRNKS
jgi:hypothetical protein